MTILLSSSSGQPLFEQIRQQLQRQIVSGALPEGAELPSLRKLANELGVSLITTKRAYEDLEREGLVHTMPGRGTFVASLSGDYLREKKLTHVQESLAKAVAAARDTGLSRQDTQELFDLLWEVE